MIQEVRSVQVREKKKKNPDHDHKLTKTMPTTQTPKGSVFTGDMKVIPLFIATFSTNAA